MYLSIYFTYWCTLIILQIYFSSEILAILLSTNSKSNKVFDWSIDRLILLHVIGEEAIEIYNTFQFATEEDRIKLNVLKSKFQEYVNPRKNTVFERYWALTICMKNPEIPWRIQMERFIPLEIFRKKSNTFRGITLLPFSPKRQKFSVPFVRITSARLHFERKRKIYRYFVNDTTQSRSSFQYQKNTSTIWRKIFTEISVQLVSAHRFWENKQQEGELIDQFITELKTRVKSCEFGDQHDTMLRDRIVFGVSDTQLKERLLRESSDLTLEKAASLCKAVKASKNQLKELHSSEMKPVHAVKSKSKQKPSKKPRQQQAFNCRKLELNICRKLVLRLEGFVCFAKRKTTTPKCVHKRILPSTWSIQASMPPVVDKSSRRNYLSEQQ